MTAEKRQPFQQPIAAAKAAAKKLTYAPILLKADAARAGPPRTTRGSPKPSTSAPIPSPAYGSGSSSKAWRPSGPARSNNSPAGSESATVGRKPGSPPWPAPACQRDARRGRCKCGPTNWSRERLSSPSPRRRCVSKQHLGAVVQPPPAEPGQAERFDSKHVRNGTANLFRISEPLLDGRAVPVTERRTAKDFAEVLRGLVEEVHAEAEKVAVVVENWNRQKLAPRDEALPPEQARRLAEQLAIHHCQAG